MRVPRLRLSLYKSHQNLRKACPAGFDRRFTGDHEVGRTLFGRRVPQASIVALQEITRSGAHSLKMRVLPTSAVALQKIKTLQKIKR